MRDPGACGPLRCVSTLVFAFFGASTGRKRVHELETTVPVRCAWARSTETPAGLMEIPAVILAAAYLS